MGFFDNAINDIKGEVNGIIKDAKSAVNGFLHPKKGADAKFEGAQDLRARLRVPNEYLGGEFNVAFAEFMGDNIYGPVDPLVSLGGIIFPYTPQISFESKAEYAPQNVLHSNYTQHFYKNSSVGTISVTGKFTVQNEEEGRILLATIHLLRALPKMRFGNDEQSGSPPPVCRFDAYGDYMLYNVPVSVASFSHELPDGVDYFMVGKKGSPTVYGHSLVPVMSTIKIDLNVMYSRREMLNHNIPEWISGGLNGKGYL